MYKRQEQAQAYLISKLMEKQDYEQAQKVLDTISKKRVLDREQLQANLYIAQGELEKAAKLTEEKFLSATTEIHGAVSYTHLIDGTWKFCMVLAQSDDRFS